jgi:monoamine oxidase
MLLKREEKLDPEEDAMELEPLFPRRPERLQWNPLALPQHCLKLVQGTRVAVVGGGLAGLMAARVLCQYGVKVTVFEAHKEVGGRVRSNTSFSKARITEEGAELIGSFHTKWLDLAREYGLAMISRMDPALYQKAGLDVKLTLENESLKRAEFMKLEKEMEERVLKPIARFARRSVLDPSRPWRRQPWLKKFDGMSVQEALTKIFKIAKRTKEDKLLWKMIEFKLVNDEVAPLDKMNFLGLLCKVRGGQGEHFGFGSLPLSMRYWDELEIFRCADGCQQLAKEMAKEIKEKCDRRIYLNTMVTVIDISSGGIRLTWVPVRGGKPDPGPGQREPFDFVILAIPPSVWDDVRIIVNDKVVPLKDTPGLMRMRPAVKFFSDVKERFWIKEKAAPYGGALTLGQVWEGTDNQTQVREIPDPQDPQGQPRKVEQGIVLSVFAGPILADGKVPTERGFTDGLSRLYRGYKANKTLFSDWPNPNKEPFIKTGYASPEPNQIFTIGRKLSDPTPEEQRFFHGRLFFAGEHTEMAFFGYMEGALRSGENAAKTLMLKKCGLLKEPAPKPSSPPLMARGQRARENTAYESEIGALSDEEWEAEEAWEELEEDHLTPQPDEKEGESLADESVPLSEDERELQSPEALRELHGQGYGFSPVRAAQNILFVGAERGDQFVCQGHGVTAINPRETGSVRGFRRTGGKFIRARIEDLPPESCRFDLICENYTHASAQHHMPARSFALARLSRLKPAGRWILVTAWPRYASLLKAVGDYDEAVQRNFTVTLSRLAPDEAPSSLSYSRGETRFRLIFQRCR